MTTLEKIQQEAWEAFADVVRATRNPIGRLEPSGDDPRNEIAGFLARAYEAGGDDRELRRYLVMETCAAEGWDFDRFLRTYAVTIEPLLKDKSTPPTTNTP